MPKSLDYIRQALEKKVSGDGEFTQKCTEWIKNRFNAAHALLTTSCSHALDMAACLCGTKAGDEVVMASFTFTSTANAFVGRGAKIVFVDVRPDTMNINENLIEDSITDKTRAIVPVHYAGIPCEMDVINDLANKYNLYVVEDAAQGVMSTYKGRALGTLSDFGCYSFHETKNYSMGEGGALLIKNEDDLANAEIIREKGTDRSRFYRGHVDRYSWMAWGSSYLPSDINAAYLWSQLEYADEINTARLDVWHRYEEALRPLADRGYIELPSVPPGCTHNAHLFYIKTTDVESREGMIKYLRERGIYTVFHYIPLHSSRAGQEFGRFHGEDKYTTKDSSRLLRLPLYYGLKQDEAEKVVKQIFRFFSK